MKRLVTIPLLASVAALPLLLVAARGRPAPERAPAAAQEAEINPVVRDCNTTLPPATVTRAIATGGLPCAVAADSPFTLARLQVAFDFNSWLTFVALNAPSSGAASTGTAASGAVPAADAPSVWEGWQDLFSLIMPDGSPPPPFGEAVPVPAICRNVGSGEVMQMISKTPVTPVVSVSGQPLRSGPLIDQNGHYARYQILVNRPMYDYIVANRLYSRIGQAHFKRNVTFPMGQVDSGTVGRVGAIVIKAAWKVLDPKDPNDAPSRFHVMHARIYTPPSEGVTASCRPGTLGLVGLHIVHKTRFEPQWNWATFEHVDNVPTAAETAAEMPARHYNFYRQGCSARNCPPNAQPPRPWDATRDPFPHGFHSQIVRTTTYPPEATASADTWNAQFHAALAGTVWTNYRLVTTQWPTNPTSAKDPNGMPFPLLAANTTMESYVQGNVLNASSSCMACHGNATTVNGRPSDFSFILERAH